MSITHQPKAGATLTGAEYEGDAHLGGLLATDGGQDTIKPHGSMGATETFDPADGNVHTGTLNADCTFTLTSPSGSGACSLVLWLSQDGSGGWGITWPGSVTVDGTLDVTASTTSRVILETVDGGTSWVASVVGASAPATAAYVVAASDASIPNGVVIPGLAGSADIKGSGANDDEFDVTDASPPIGSWTTLGSPTSQNANSTALSHYYVKKSATGTLGTHGIYKASPSTPFTMTAKLSDSTIRNIDHGAGIFVGETTPGKMASLYLGASSGTLKFAFIAATWTNPTTFNTTVTALDEPVTAPVYLRIVASSSTSVGYYWSYNGIVWTLLSAAHNPSFTIGSVGLIIIQDNATYDLEAAFDWVRFV